MEKKILFLIVLIAALSPLSGCASQPAAAENLRAATATPRALSPTHPPVASPPPANTPFSTPAAALPTPQPIATPVQYGPNQEDFPPNVNPLSGEEVENPSLLKEPALLVSMPHFPIAARPQSGLSFAPWVFEFLVGEGTTRFLPVFYGDRPYAEEPLNGGCEMRSTPFVRSETMLGNFVWLDQNRNGTQDVGERGIGGVCVRLYDKQENLLEETATDSNGYYGFNVKKGETYRVEFVPPPNLAFSPANRGLEDTDSDANPSNGRSEPLLVEDDYLHLDAGFAPRTNLNLRLSGGQIGPVRSGRLIYIHIHDFFQNSCLIFSGATKEIIDQLPFCAQVHNSDNPAGAMLDIERMERISQKNARGRENTVNYSGNLFSETPPEGGQSAAQVDFFISTVNQTHWVYDPLTKSWARYVDNASENPVFRRDTDRLTGRELSFENIIVIFVEHEVIMPHIADMHLEGGLQEKGYLFRDGQIYPILWSTRAGEYEQRTGLRRPPSFLDTQGNPIALRPGQTWILIATPYSKVTELEPQHWKIRVYSPEGLGEY